ncbi:MAG: hypothetical protein JRI70_07795 [Deltaproteobacteria bacterium]|nr:hypothetical protein [Deltaproteobacteria bacterium]MBW1859962.1 hypothetical protein [Deltaproteobacteria bacterium]
MSPANLTERSKAHLIPIGLSLVCFFYYMSFLFRYGEMFYRGSDVVASTTYAITMFREVYHGGWSVPKPVHMLLFGSVYWITRDLWFVNLVCVLATALTVFVGCWLILRHYHTTIGCIAFCVFMMTIPRMFRTTMMGGAGCINVLFLLLAVACVERIDRMTYRILAIAFLCLANLTRPDSWPATYLIILLIVTLRLSSWSESKLNKSDLLFLIPMGMPLIWVLIDWAVFVDPLYSMKKSQSFVVEVASGKSVSQGLKVNDWTAYPPLVKDAFFDMFTLSSWFSLRAAVLIILSLAGIVVMFLKQPRILLLLVCPFLGSILFYFVSSLREMLFRYGYIYYAFVFVCVAVSIGLASLCDLTRHVRRRYVGRFIQVGLASLILLFLTTGPYEQTVIRDTIPTLKKWAALSKLNEPAIESIVDDVNRNAGSPIIVTTQWVPGNRIALKLSTGKNIFSVEKLMAKENLGQKTLLPNFEGKSVYFAAPESTGGAVNRFLHTLIMKSKRREVIYDRGGIVVLKCLY